VEFIDVGSRFAFVFGIKSLDLIVQKYIVLRNLLNTQLNIKVKLFHSDGHGSYTSSLFASILAEDGTMHKMRSPYSPEQNAIAERRIRTIVEMAHTMLLHSNVPANCWEDAVSHANYIRNRVATRVLRNCTPYEKLWKRKPDLQWLKPFGCLVYVLVHKSFRDGKFDATSVPGVLLGISELHSGYKVLLLSDRSVKVARDIRFYEETFPYRQNPAIDLQWMNPTDMPNLDVDHAGIFVDPFIQNDAKPNAELEKERILIYNQRLPSSAVTFPVHSSDANRILNVITEGVENPELSFKDLTADGIILSIPEVTVSDAINGPDREKWVDAFRIEYNAILKTGTFKPLDEKTKQMIHNGTVKIHKT
jgi:hypothetical protein